MAFDRRWFFAGVVGLAIASSGCNFSGACVGIGGSVDECKDDWDRSDCDAWQDQQVSGNTWTFYPGETCAERGFSTPCDGGGYNSWCY
jgi:hypothetical protein